MAVDIDDVSPLWASCRLISDPVIRFKSMIVPADVYMGNTYLSTHHQYQKTSKDDCSDGCSVGVNYGLFHTEQAEWNSLRDLTSLSTSSRSSHHDDVPACALLRACVLASGVLDELIFNDMDTGRRHTAVGPSEINCERQVEKNDSAQEIFRECLKNRFGGGFEVTSCSLIPSGSGMGGSSILAAVAIKALLHRLTSCNSENSTEANARLIDMVSIIHVADYCLYLHDPYESYQCFILYSNVVMLYRLMCRLLLILVL